MEIAIYIDIRILSTKVISAGNQPTEFISSFVNHFASSCSFKTRSPATISEGELCSELAQLVAVP